MRDFLGGPVVKNSPANAEDTGQSLVWQDPACPGATNPVLENPEVTATDPVHVSATVCSKRRPSKEMKVQHSQ